MPVTAVATLPRQPRQMHILAIEPRVPEFDLAPRAHSPMSEYR